MCYPFETYAFVPMLDQVEELESKGLLHGKGGASNVAMYNAICCAVDRDQKVEIAGKEVVDGWTKPTPIGDLSESVGINRQTGMRILTRMEKEGVFERERKSMGWRDTYRFRLNVYNRNHDRLEQLGEVGCETPFTAFYCLPYEDRTAELKSADMLKRTPVAIYDSVLSYVDRNHKVDVRGKKYVSGWTIVIGQAAIGRRAGINYTQASRWLNLMVKEGLIERQKIGMKYRYRVVIWRDALKRIGDTIVDDRGDDKSDDSDNDASNRELIEKNLEKSPPSPPNSENEAGADYNYLMEKAVELSVSFNELFRGGKFMAQRLKRSFAEKIFESLKDLVSEEKIRALGVKAMEIAVRIHEKVFNSLSFRQDSPYSPGYLMTEGGSIAISEAMEKVLSNKRPENRKEPPRRSDSPPPRATSETIERKKLDPLAQKLYDKYIKPLKIAKGEIHESEETAETERLETDIHNGEQTAPKGIEKQKELAPIKPSKATRGSVLERTDSTSRRIGELLPEAEMLWTG